MEDADCHDVPRPARPVRYTPTIYRRTIAVAGGSFFCVDVFVVLDKEKQTMTPGSVFGSGGGHADCTSKRRIWSDGGASRTLEASSHRSNASGNGRKKSKLGQSFVFVTQPSHMERLLHEKFP